jgi:hypothetical protein
MLALQVGNIRVIVKAQSHENPFLIPSKGPVTRSDLAE